MLIKMFDENHEIDLEEAINDFLQTKLSNNKCSISEK